MPASLKAVIFNNEEGFGGELRRLVQPLRHIKIVAEIGEVSLLEDCLKRFGCEVVLVNLDPQPEDYLKQISQIVSHLPGVKVFAFSAKEDAQLILSAMRAGIGEFITKPVDGPELVKSLGKIMELAPEKAAGRLIAVTGASGGCGATMIACNLAAELSGLHREEMGLIDLDFDFGAAAAFFDVSPQYSISELASSDTIEQSMLSDSLVRHPSQVAILARPTRMEDAHVLSADRSAAIISMMSEMFPIVVIDFPPHFDQLGCAVLDQLDLLILVVNLNVPSIKNAERIGDALNRRGFSSEKIKVVVNGDTGQKAKSRSRTWNRCFDIRSSASFPMKRKSSAMP